MSLIENRIGIVPLSPALGAEIVGVDVSRELAAEVVEQIRDAWNRHIVLVFRCQNLTMDQQLRFASYFGPLGERRRGKTALKKKEEGVLQTNPHTLLVSNMKVDGKPIGAFGEGEMWFHIDSGYAERPYKYTFLYGMEIPSRGGNTRFANMYMAFETLPADLKAEVEGRRALHVHEYKRAERTGAPKDLSGAPHRYHPIVATHPETGRKSLFVDRLMTAAVEGMAAAESEALLTRLFDHAENPAFIYEHVWRVNDFIMWDNRCVTHARTDFPREENRLLRRCTVEGEPIRA